MAKVFIYSPNVIGQSMAGAAIRSWEFARILSQTQEVVLCSPGKTTLQSADFQIISDESSAFKKFFQKTDILITQRLTIPLAWRAKFHGIKIIIDAYNPSPLELLEHFQDEPMLIRQDKVYSAISNLIFSFKMADGILCASEKQRNLWIGFLLAQKLIPLTVYDQDRHLRHLLQIVPFGLSSTPPQKNGLGLKEKYGFLSTDKVILWGGGIWNWFDPLSLIQAMKLISCTRSDIKLVFMGIKPPDSNLPEMSMSAKAIQLSKDLDLLNKLIFFNHEWIPYEDRQNILLDADIGVSTHFDHLETQFSFRTRILDYFWAQLPILATTGDTFAELIKRHELGEVVPYQDTKAIAQAIVALVNDSERMKKMKQNLGNIKIQFYWQSVLDPLQRMIERLSHIPKSKQSLQDIKTILNFARTKFKEKGLKACLNKIYQQYF